MKPRQIDIHIDRIALGSRLPGGERSLREAIARELAVRTRTSGTSLAGPRGRHGRVSDIANDIAGQVRLALHRGAKP